MSLSKIEEEAARATESPNLSHCSHWFPSPRNAWVPLWFLSTSSSLPFRSSHSFNKCFLSAFYMPGTELCVE